MTMHRLQSLCPDLCHRQMAGAFEQREPLRDGVPGACGTAKRLHVGPPPLYLLRIHPRVVTQGSQNQIGRRMLEGDKQHWGFSGHVGCDLPREGGFAHPWRAPQEMQPFVEAI
jgi:hypothetical protein